MPMHACLQSGVCAHIGLHVCKFFVLDMCLDRNVSDAHCVYDSLNSEMPGLR